MYNHSVIQSFDDPATAAVYHGRDDKFARRLPKELWPVIRRKLDRLNAVVAVADLRVPAGNRLESLKGAQARRFSMRVNQQYRVTFGLLKETPLKYGVKTTIRKQGATMIPTHRAPTHPGEMLLEEFLKPMQMTQVVAAAKMGIPVNRLNEVIRGKRGVTADTALRLAKLLKTSPEFWMNLQTAWDLYHASRFLARAS
jgi:addiction module HigA family antidote